MNNFVNSSPNTSIFKKQWLPLEQAIQRVAKFEHEFGKAHLLLAYHAALPSILTPELVNLIRINFLEKSVEWIAESDLLLSPLCLPINQGIFEIEPQIRQVLLVALQTDSEYGAERLEEIAYLLDFYNESPLARKIPIYIKRTYKWISSAYLDPDATVQNMFDFLKNTSTNKFILPEYFQTGKTLAMIANQLEMTSLQVELEDLVGATQLLTLYWTDNRENLLSILQNDLNNWDGITHVLTNSITNWMINSERENHRNISQISAKEQRLRALIANQDGFLQDRLSSFVGRQHELAEIRNRLNQLLPTGGYVTITGQAGQGKSSLIAKLIVDYGVEQVAYHFIPLNPGPDHQVELLRNVMARLILKYGLADFYVASESRLSLRDYFPKVLEEVAAKGGQEIIFLDGLDQLAEGLSGDRDLSFLPINPPQGVVFVLGTRPNDTLKPLLLYKPRLEYPLPSLSRLDFDLILTHRKVQLEPNLADQLYTAMGENALYLDLAARELAEADHIPPSELIAHITPDPENLFSLSIARLKRLQIEWREVIKPILGILMVEREPLSRLQIKRILDLGDDRLRDGLARLGGLIAEDGQMRYSLFHMKLRDYLKQDEAHPEREYIFAKDEEVQWHTIIASWCEQGGISLIWDTVENIYEQCHREYARRHYISHLYFACQRLKLFEVLDSTQYGQDKVRYDPSGRSYAQDLDFGRQAACWATGSIDESLAMLPRLWQYTLLRCSLNSRADTYTPRDFAGLLMQNRVVEALGLAELLTHSAYKAKILAQIASHLSERPDESLQLLMRAEEIIITLQDPDDRDKALSEISNVLVQMQLWEKARTAISTIQDKRRKAMALGTLARTLMQGAYWQEAEMMINSIEDNEQQVRGYIELVAGLVLAQQWEQATRLVAQAEIIAQKNRNGKQDSMLEKLRFVSAQASKWKLGKLAQHDLEKSILNTIEEIRQVEDALEEPQKNSQENHLLYTIEDGLKEIEDAEAYASALEAKIDIEGLLQLVQHTWSQVNTRDYALRLLPLANGLIAFKPDIGRKLQEASTWVGKFLGETRMSPTRSPKA